MDKEPIIRILFILLYKISNSRLIFDVRNIHLEKYLILTALKTPPPLDNKLVSILL